MIFWALDNADDATIVMFGSLIIIGVALMLGVVLVDWLRNKKSK